MRKTSLCPFTPLCAALLLLGSPVLAQEKPAPAEPNPEKKGPVDVEQALVRGVPLGNDTVSVHAVQRKSYANHGRHEVALFPLVAQINGKFTTHLGVGAMYAWHMHENLAFQVSPIFNYVAADNPFNQELLNKGRQQAQAATALVMWLGGMAGVEVTPMYGKFAFYEATLGHFTIVLNAGVGAGMTRIQLVQPLECEKDEQDCKAKAAAFGDTGMKFMGSIGGGFRVYLGEHLALRIEVRDIVYTARVDHINGCDASDFQELSNNRQPPSASCNSDAFGTTGSTRRDAQISAGYGMLKESSSDVLNNILFFGGISWNF